MYLHVVNYSRLTNLRNSSSGSKAIHMTDFFNQLTGLAGFGLVGIVIIMVVVLAYVVIKRPNNKFAILILASFCLIVVVLFTFAGVGVARENEKLKDDKQELVATTDRLKDSVRGAETKLEIKDLQLKVATDETLSNTQLEEISNTIASKADTLEKVAGPSKSNDWSKVAVDYRLLSEAIRKDSVNKSEAKKKILTNPKLFGANKFTVQKNK